MNEIFTIINEKWEHCWDFLPSYYDLIDEVTGNYNGNLIKIGLWK